MGTGKITRCKSCDDEQIYYLGIGMLFSDAMNILDCFPQGAQKKITEIYRSFLLEDETLEYAIYECEKCETTHSRLFLEITYDNGKVYAPAYKCSECRSNLRKSKRKLTSYRCRKCAQHTLDETNEILNWD